MSGTVVYRVESYQSRCKTEMVPVHTIVIIVINIIQTKSTEINHGV